MTTHTSLNPEILVLCGHGKVGRRVLERLHARGIPARVGSRATDPAFDWTDRASWSAALDGVSAVFIAYHPDLAVPGAVEAVADLAALAKRVGVQRLVLLSGRGEAEAQRAERAVQSSGLAWSIVRCSWFNQNFDEGMLLHGVLSDVIALPAGTVREPFVDADDIADVAVAALTDARHSGQVYELTGPKCLSFAEVAAELSRATGRSIRYEPLSVDSFAAALAEEETPAEMIDFLSYLFAEVLDGRNDRLTDGVERALGRPPRAFADYARQAAASGAWDRSSLTSDVQ